MNIGRIAIIGIIAATQSVHDYSALDGGKHKSGVFYGTLKLQPVGDGVHMSVLETFSYSDAYGHILSAQPGFVTDGASIPRALWTVVGSPFTGKYIGAAVIHDVGCVSHKYSWELTDRMFYDAMLDLKVSDHLAKLMYYGVRVGGPRWKSVSLSAATEAELGAAIAKSGAISITETSGTSNQKRHTAQVIVPYPQEPLSESDLKAFDRELSQREKENNPVSTTEIENRTMPKAELKK